MADTLHVVCPHCDTTDCIALDLAGLLRWMERHAGTERAAAR